MNKKVTWAIYLWLGLAPLGLLDAGCNKKTLASPVNFWDLLKKGGGSPEARAWYEAGNEIIKTLDF